MRQLTPTLFYALLTGGLHAILEYVKADDTLDMEFRGNYFTIYYRGGALLNVKENPDGSYSWEGLKDEYLLKGKNKYEQKHKDAEQFEEYIPEAKHIIDRYIVLGSKNHLGEKEIQQLVVKENNYSPNSQDTDYFIVDMEYEEAGENGRFDLIALRWDSTGTARKKNVVSLAVIEVKQGSNSVRTSTSSPGLNSHTKDFNAFVTRKSADGGLKEFCDDMAMIFKQKCELGLISANKKIEGIKQVFPLSVESTIDFICLLANYKKASENLRNELAEMDSCRFIRSHYTGYGLYADEIFTLTSETI
jgi:hypothetical protein